MARLAIVTDLEACRRLWEEHIPQIGLTDRWDVRSCFQEHYRRPACFIVATDARGLCGLLPLSWIAEQECFGYFPGETWQGKTWLERNRIVAKSPTVLEDMLAHCPGPCQLRYLQPPETGLIGDLEVDELNYAFLPPAYGWDMEAYWLSFSHKTAKRLRKEVAALEARGLSYRLDEVSDFELLIHLNRERFGESSYFHDARFAGSCRALVKLLAARGHLRMTTITHDDQVAAVDMGCLYRGVYTLLAGGTHADYPGIAKLINLHHLARACREGHQEVDFLCGDFFWKPLFHLIARPFYKLSNGAALTPQPASEQITNQYGLTAVAAEVLALTHGNVTLTSH